MRISRSNLSQQFVDFYAARAAAGEPLTLVVVAATSGSTYSKPGNVLLVDGHGESSGLLSGGCLEEDLAERAANVMDSGQPDSFSYDLSADDEVFGLGVGCEGVMQILLQPLTAAKKYEPLGGVLAAMNEVRSGELRFAVDEHRMEIEVLRPRRVLLLGAGRDAVPLVNLCRSLGWHTTVSDHRSRYIDRILREKPQAASCGAADELHTRFDLAQYDAAIVMSHHLASDRTYLTRLAASPIEFIGLMGPPHRRDRLLGEIGDDARTLDGRLRSPVGKRIGGRGPSAIALEIAVELQEFFCAS